MSLCAASLRMLATRACCFASVRQVFLRFLPPILRRDFCRSRRLRRFWACFKARGFAKVVPSEQVASDLIPRSTPIAVVAVGVGFSCSISTWILTNQCPACSLTVAASTFASVGMKSVHANVDDLSAAIARHQEKTRLRRSIGKSQSPCFAV